MGKNSRANIDLKLKEVLLKLAETNEKNKVFELISKYLTDNIVGTACSIFLLDPTTDELKIVYSSHNFSDVEKKEAVYKRQEGGFTIWPLENKKLLYIRDETDLVEMNNINPKPTHLGSKGGKPSETKRSAHSWQHPL